MANDRMRECPYCREEISAQALKCKHCGSGVEPTLPDHGGVCPYCRESIHPEAVICRHCRSHLTKPSEPSWSSTSSNCGCSQNVSWARASSEFAAAAVGHSTAASSGFTRRPQCETWCDGSTLMCACRVRVPGLGEGIVIYPCGTCINDPGPIITAVTSRLTQE